MPPKKKGKGKKGKKKGKKKNDAELTIDDKYKKTLHEIEALKDHLEPVMEDLPLAEFTSKVAHSVISYMCFSVLAEKLFSMVFGGEIVGQILLPASRKEIARRAQAHSEEWKKKMEAAHEDLVSQKDDQKSITTDMTRQYKHMQTEMNAEVHRLAAELDKTKTKLAHTEKQLQETTAEKEKITKEKDDLIAELQDKIKNMEFSYESMMQEALDNMVIKLDLAQKRWQEQATNIHFEHKQKLMEFGLNPLDI